MHGRAQRKPSKGKGHGIDSADSLPMTLGRPLVSPGFAGCHRPGGRRQRMGESWARLAAYRNSHTGLCESCISPDQIRQGPSRRGCNGRPARR
jgi:hypothetical protein